jgi:hypothetical protein
MSSLQHTPGDVKKLRLKKLDSGAGKRVLEDQVRDLGKRDEKQGDQKPLPPVIDLTEESSSVGTLPAPKKAKTTAKVPSTNTPKYITSIDIKDIWVSVTKILKKMPIVGSENMLEMLNERCNDNLACKNAFKTLIPEIEGLHAEGLSNVEKVCEVASLLKEHFPAGTKNIISWSVYKATWIPQFHDAVTRREFFSGRAGCWGWWLATAPARALAKRKHWDIILEDLISMGFYPNGPPANGVLTPGFVLYDKEYRVVAVKGKSIAAAAINWGGCMQYYENLAASSST